LLGHSGTALRKTFSKPSLALGMTSPPTPKQLEYLRELGYSGLTSELTVKSASETIEKLKQQVRPDLCTLDLVGVFAAFGYSATEVEAGKYWVKCPWADEHSWTHLPDTVIWQSPGHWPEFYCAHNHCADRKLVAVIAWAESIRPGIVNEHCSHQLLGDESRAKTESKLGNGCSHRPANPEQRKIVSRAEAIANAERFLCDFSADEADLWHVSPVRLGEDWRSDAILLLEHLYLPDEFVCICVDYQLLTKADGSQKTVPKGSGRTQTTANWIKYIQANDVPESAAGAWIRLNPVIEHGSGRGGSHKDSEVTAWRNLLVESDVLPIELQLAVFGRLALPIVALVSSGRKSIHAWIRLDSVCEADFRADADFVLTELAPYGTDRANRNPSRYSRLPGALRNELKALDTDCTDSTDSGRQYLLYLNPNPTGGPIFQ
jgi:hypothetical protein